MDQTTLRASSDCCRSCSRTVSRVRFDVDLPWWSFSCFCRRLSLCPRHVRLVSATSFPERRPGSHARPGCRPALPVHEREPGRHYVCVNLDGVSMPGRGAGCLEPQAKRGASVWDRRLVPRKPPRGFAGPTPCAPRWCWRWPPASVGRGASSSIPTRGRNTRSGRSASAARKQACGRPWGRRATPMTTPCANASSPSWNAGCWSAAGSPCKPRPAWPASLGLRLRRGPSRKPFGFRRAPRMGARSAC